jgi:hypothetical protein
MDAEYKELYYACPDNLQTLFRVQFYNQLIRSEFFSNADAVINNSSLSLPSTSDLRLFDKGSKVYLPTMPHARAISELLIHAHPVNVQVLRKLGRYVGRAGPAAADCEIKQKTERLMELTHGWG